MERAVQEIGQAEKPVSLKTNQNKGHGGSTHQQAETYDALRSQRRICVNVDRQICEY